MIFLSESGGTSGSSSPSTTNSTSWDTLIETLHSCEVVVAGLLGFISQHSLRRVMSVHNVGMHDQDGGGGGGSGMSARSGAAAGSMNSSRYKTTMCRDLSIHGSCPRGKNCSFAHSPAEMEQ